MSRQPKVKSHPKIQFTYTPSINGPNHNLLVLFHGLGDRAGNFINFGKKMELPQTALLAIQGPDPIPYFDEGTGWWPSFDTDGNPLDPIQPLIQSKVRDSRVALLSFLEDVVFQSAGSTSTSNGGWPIANVYFLGFGQGGSMALELAINYQRNGRPLGLGGVISLSGFLSSFEKSNQASTSDVLITYGSDEDVPESLLERHRSVLSSRLELCKVTGKSQEMPKSPAEMRKIMEFFGARLALRNLAMESSADIIELTNE